MKKPLGPRVAVAALLTGFALLWGISSLSWPFGTDQGFWAWIGDAIAHGGAPYRDALDSKGPVALYLGAVPHLLFGRNEWGMRLLELAWLAAGVALLVRAGHLRERGWAAWAAGTTFFLLHAGSGFWDTAQPDGWAGIILIGAASLAMRGLHGGTWRLVLSGALVGACVLIKPTYLAFLAIPVLGALLRGGSLVRQTLGIVASVAGLALSVGAVLGALSFQGALGDFLDVQRWSASVYSGLGWELPFWRIRSTIETLLTAPFVVLLPIAFLGTLSSWRHDRRQTLIVLAWGAAGLVNLAVQGKFWPYQAMSLYGPIAWLAGVGAVELLTALAPAVTAEGVPNRNARALAVTLLAVSGGALALPSVSQVAQWASMEVGLLTHPAYLDAVATVPDHPATSVRAVAAYLADHTRPEDYVYVWGGEPAVYYLADRRSPTRFGTSRQVVQGKDSPLRDRYRAELTRDLAVHPPRYVVVAAPERCGGELAAHFRCASSWPEFLRMLDGYRLETTIDGYLVLRSRRDTLR